MAWRNIWRNRRRSILTISAIGFACVLLVFVLSLQFGMYNAMINAAVKILTGAFQVQAQGYQENRNIWQVIPDPDAVGRVLDRTNGVTAYTFRTTAFSLAASADRTYGVMVTGIVPEREARVSTLKNMIRKGTYLESGDADQAVLGDLLAKNLKVDVGDAITLLGQGRDGSVAAGVLTVKGIFKSGQDALDRNSLYMPLSYFQEMYFMNGAVHQAVALTPSVWHAWDVADQVRAEIQTAPGAVPLAVLDWKQLTPGLAQSILLDLTSGMIFYAFLLIVVAFSILNTFLMVIFERTREFGVLMAMGITVERLMRLLLAESMIMTLIGVAAGTVAGAFVTLYFQTHGIDMGASEMFRQYGIPGRIHPFLNPISAVAGPVMVIFITFWMALYPALKVRKLRPAEAMKYA
jgi:ABC-type lipoprotein release transport system permease subunit